MAKSFLRGSEQVLPNERPVYDYQYGDLDNEGLPVDGAWGGANLVRGAIGHPIIDYKGIELRGDLYRMGDHLALNLYCPRCLHSIWIRSERKRIDYDPETNRVSVERFRCPWELGRGTDGTSADRIAFGVGLCRWTVAIDQGSAKDA